MEDNGASVLLIFQAPGLEEWSKGKPVISTTPSSAGVRLVTAFNLAHRQRQDYNITNAVQCFPGKKTPSGASKPRDKTPPVQVRRHCAKWLRQDIEAQEYKRIVVFGAPARDAVRALGYGHDPRVRFVTHPTGGISNSELADAMA